MGKSIFKTELSGQQVGKNHTLKLNTNRPLSTRTYTQNTSINRKIYLN